MKVKKKSRDMAEKYITEMIQVIREEGTSINVNLRALSKRIGCAHTNAYNYFDGFDGLKWEAMKRALDIYEKHLLSGITRELSAWSCFTKFIENYVSFSAVELGLFRLITTDPLDIEKNG